MCIVTCICLYIGIAWSIDPNSFFSVARDGLLIRHYLGDGIQIAKQANPVALALNCRGSLAHALGGEPGRRMRNNSVVASTGMLPGFETSLRRPFRDSFGGNISMMNTMTAATKTPHQLLVTRRSCEFILT